MQVTVFLQRLHRGDRDAIHAVIPMVYEELKKLARSHLRRELKVDSSQTTALVHEAFLKLSASRQPIFENRSHFYGIASRLMRQVLVDMARARCAEKRGAGRELPLADLPERSPQPNRSVLAIDDALNQLQRMDPLKGQLIEMRYFGGMTAEELSAAVSKPLHIVRRELRLAQAWLRKEMSAQTVCGSG